MNLEPHTIKYFERQRKKYDQPVCIIYIDAHGGETMEENCSKDSATVFSFAGVSGAVSYAVKYKDNEGSVASSLFFRELISKINTTPTTKSLKPKLEEISDLIKPRLKRHSKKAKPDRVKKWSVNHFDNYALTPMKQINQKRYSFFETDISFATHFDFGIHVIDIVYPPNHPPDQRLETLRGQNLVTQYFDEEEMLFPEAREYLTELSENAENKKAFEYPVRGIAGDEDILVRVITFDQLIHLLKLLGFEYSYIFDDSCRSNKLMPKKEIAFLKDIKKLKTLAEKERKVSLEKLPFKMKSTSMPKTRKRILSDLKKSDPFVKDVRKGFHKKIEDYLDSELDKVKDFLIESDNEDIDPKDIWLELVEDTNKKMSFILHIDPQDILIDVFIDFLKVKEIVVEGNPIGLLRSFIRNIKGLKQLSINTL